MLDVVPQICPQCLVARGVLGAEGGDIRRVGGTAGVETLHYLFVLGSEGLAVGGLARCDGVRNEVARTL